MASWKTSTMHCAAFAIIFLALISYTSARREDLYKNTYEDVNFGKSSDTQDRRYDTNSFSVRNNLKSYSTNYLSSKSDSSKLNTEDSRDVSTKLRKGLADYQHNLKYHSNDFKFFADNSTTATAAPAPTTSSNTTTASPAPAPASAPTTTTTTKPAATPGKFSETTGDTKLRGTFPWILLIFVVIGFALIAALLFLTMTQKDTFIHGNIHNDFAPHHEVKKNDEEQINKEIQDNLNKNTVANNQGI